MTDGPQFRIADASDAELLLDFMQAYYALDGFAYDREKARAPLIPFLQNPNFGRAWLVLDGETPVGYAVLCFGYSLEWLGRDAFVDELFLREDYRGRGWGRTTMVFLEDAARKLGVKTLHLGVVEGNHRPCVYTKRLDSANIKALSCRSGLQRMSPSPRDRATRV